MSDHYTYRVSWSAEDEEYLGLCAEFPSLSWLAPTPDEALAGVRKVASDCVADMRANGEDSRLLRKALRHVAEARVGYKGSRPEGSTRPSG